MCGWLKLETVRASRSKRSRSCGLAERCSGRTLTATMRSSRVSRARYTSPYSWVVSQGKSSFCRGKRKPLPTARGKGGAAPNQEVFFLTGLSRNKRLCFWPALSPARAQRVAVCPRLAPGGGNGKGGESNSLLPQANSAGSLAPVNDGKI